MLKGKPYKKEFIQPDALYNSRLITLLISKVLKSGKKSLAKRIVYQALDLIYRKTKKRPIIIFENAIRKIQPEMEVKKQKIKGSNRQVPKTLNAIKRIKLGLSWLIHAARIASGPNISIRLAQEIINASRGKGASIKRKQESRKKTNANRALTSFKR